MPYLDKWQIIGVAQILAIGAAMSRGPGYFTNTRFHELAHLLALCLWLIFIVYCFWGNKITKGKTK